MRHTIREIAVRMLPLLLVALTSTVQASRAERLSQFQKYAEAPVKEFHYFQFNGYETLSDDTVAVWVGVNKVYLLKLQPCPELNYTNAISLSGSPTRVFTQSFGTVNVGHSRCMVDSIRPVDYKAMRNAAKADKTSAD